MPPAPPKAPPRLETGRALAAGLEAERQLLARLQAARVLLGAASACSGGPVEEVTAGVLPSETVAALSDLYGHGPPGRFLRGQHGITHFRLREPAAGPQRARIAVLSHGLGADSYIYEGAVVDGLVAAGWRVLSYDFLGHGWSVADEKFLQYDKEKFLTQARELLDHVLKPEEPVDIWVGHSTGGILGILAALARTRPFRDLALISPAVYANKPLIARVADRIPNFLHGLTQKYKFMQTLVENAYQENNDNAFAKEGGAYLFPEKHLATREMIKRKFKHNTHLLGSLAGITMYFLRADLLAEFRLSLKELVSKDAQSWAPRVFLLWGKMDTVVPFASASEIVSWAGSPGRVTLVPLHAGHESTLEIPRDIAREILKIASAPASRL